MKVGATKSGSARAALLPSHAPAWPTIFRESVGEDMWASMVLLLGPDEAERRVASFAAVIVIAERDRVRKQKQEADSLQRERERHGLDSLAGRIQRAEYRQLLPRPRDMLR